MKAGWLPALFFCLVSGAALGCFFLLLKFLRILLRAGKLCTGILDAVFCLFCAGAIFLCALAVDYGRLRLFQVLFQGIGAWSAVAALDPFVSGAAARARKIFCKAKAFFHRRRKMIGAHFHKKKGASGKKREKTSKKTKKAQKKT